MMQDAGSNLFKHDFSLRVVVTLALGLDQKVFEADIAPIAVIIRSRTQDVIRNRGF